MSAQTPDAQCALLGHDLDVFAPRCWRCGLDWEQLQEEARLSSEGKPRAMRETPGSNPGVAPPTASLQTFAGATK